MIAKQIMPIILDKNFNRLGIVDDYKSLIWTTRYNDHGDFELVVNISTKNFEYCNKGMYVMRDDDENVGVIEKIEAKMTDTDEQIFIFSGRFLTWILTLRIIAEQTQVNSSVAAAINKLINENIISPSIASRAISNFILGTYSTTETIEAQFTGKELYTVIHDICVQYKLGFKITLNASNKFVFMLYKGVDRSATQSDNPHMIFSDLYDNLLNFDFVIDYTNTVNAVLAAGEGEGDQRKTIWVETDNSPSGLDRFEFYDDSRNTSSNEGEISEADYMAQLAEIGRENFTPYTRTLGGDVNFSSVTFKIDVNVGDIITIYNSRLGFSYNARIIEVIESIDESGKYTVIPTFGQ